MNEWYVEYETDGDKNGGENELDLWIDDDRYDNDEDGGKEYDERGDNRYPDWSVHVAIFLVESEHDE